MDPADEGVAGRWFGAELPYPDRIRVPGNWQAQGFGEARRQLRHDYQGEAWYRRTVDIPAEWIGERIWLHLVVQPHIARRGRSDVLAVARGADSDPVSHPFGPRSGVPGADS